MTAGRLLRALWGAGLLLVLAGLGTIALAAVPARIADPAPAGAAGGPGLPAGGTLTATPTASAVMVSYTYAVFTSTLTPATDLLPGSQCPRCLVPLSLPFPVLFYGQPY